jgi:flagellar protein FlbD
MIHLTRLNGQSLIVNADLIKFIENLPDTVLTLITGEKLVVKESADEILVRVAEFNRRSGRRIGIERMPSAPPEKRTADSAGDPPKSDD